jgi:hypothetical protein
MHDRQTEIVSPLQASLLQDLNHLVSRATNTVIIYVVMMVAVTVACLVLSAWYAARIHRIIEKMAEHGKKMEIQSTELSLEKQRSDTLLSQMMPKEVADQLKLHQVVKAKQYDSVTVYFSDIVGFNDISAKSSPMDVVLMLNSLYR